MLETDKLFPFCPAEAVAKIVNILKQKNPQCSHKVIKQSVTFYCVEKFWADFKMKIVLFLELGLRIFP